jgi:hypothetical protein
MSLQTRLGRLQIALPRGGEVIPANGDGRPPPPMRTANDILGLLEDVAAAVWADPFARPVEKARAVGCLAGVALKAIETGNLAARLEMLEAVLKERNGGSRP